MYCTVMVTVALAPVESVTVNLNWYVFLPLLSWTNTFAVLPPGKLITALGDPCGIVHAYVNAPALVEVDAEASRINWFTVVWKVGVALVDPFTTIVTPLAPPPPPPPGGCVIVNVPVAAEEYTATTPATVSITFLILGGVSEV